MYLISALLVKKTKQKQTLLIYLHHVLSLLCSVASATYSEMKSFCTKMAETPHSFHSMW